MAIKARLKVKGSIPWELEHKLITRYGFYVFSRHMREWIIFEKRAQTWKPEVLIDGALPKDVQDNLNKRCATIVNQFDKPEENEYVIRMRLSNIAKTLPPLQKKFIHDWIDYNLEKI